MRGSSTGSPAPGDRARNSGWAAFAVKQRQRQQGTEAEIETEAYPSLVGSDSSQSVVKKSEAKLEKPFSSVVVASTDTPSLTGISNKELQIRELFSESCPESTESIESCVSVEGYEKLNLHHPWADDSLIRDILVAVNNNVEEAQSLLEDMLISENESTQNYEVQPTYGSDSASVNTLDVCLVQKESPDQVTDDSVGESFVKPKAEPSSSLLLDIAKSLPVEPELELEDSDVYLVHRKNAIRVIRSASHHSKAANAAYERGDYLSAHLYSLKAQAERISAEKLNAKAAQEILSIRNNMNDSWTLDLHGLHAAEAVQALQERLQKVETPVSSISLAAPNGPREESGTLVASPVQCTTHLKLKNSGKQHSSPGQRPRFLQVITGEGKHSKGAAALPSAIRRFLNMNRYHFDESRPGVIMVRPKFRQSKNEEMVSSVTIMEQSECARTSLCSNNIGHLRI